MLRNVVFEVALHSANIHRVILCSIQVVHDLVCGKEAKSVGQVLEVLHDAKNTREVVAVVAGPWLGAIDALALQRRVDVEDHVDTGGVEDGSASRVIELRIDVVYANSVDLSTISQKSSGENKSRRYRHRLTYTQSLHHHSITQTDISVREHILALARLVRSLATGLIVDTNDHQSLVRDRVDKVLAADFHRVHGLRNGCEERGKKRERANGLLMVSDQYACG
jgi:hypothetical protein